MPGDNNSVVEIDLFVFWLAHNEVGDFAVFHVLHFFLFQAPCAIKNIFVRRLWSLQIQQVTVKTTVLVLARILKALRIHGRLNVLRRTAKDETHQHNLRCQNPYLNKQIFSVKSLPHGRDFHAV